jgi:hypothetical protein
MSCKIICMQIDGNPALEIGNTFAKAQKILFLASLGRFSICLCSRLRNKLLESPYQLTDSIPVVAVLGSF